MSDTTGRLGERGRKLALGGAAVGAAALALGVVLGLVRGDGFARFLHAYLVSWLFFLGISLGALFFVLLQHLTKAGWSVAVRRVAEILAANIPVLAVLFVPIAIFALAGSAALYPWADSAALHADALLAKKAAYLNAPFFVIRCAIYLGVWFALSRFYLRRSLEQDERGGADLTRRMERLSPIAMILLALTLTFAAFDLVMSLDPAWFSTIFGVYLFAGATLSFFAAIILVLLWLQRRGVIDERVTLEHYHDLGKFLFAFVFFWGYIAFSQYMLIWYTNIPEETLWFMHRQEGPWAAVSLVLVFGHFIVPFLGLLSKHAKRRLRVLGFWAAYLLVMHWVDLFWLVLPGVEPHGFPLHLLDLACFAGIGGCYLFALARLAANHSLVPQRDPRLHESMAFENI